MPSFFVQIHVFQLYHKFSDLVLKTKTTRYNNFVRSISNTLELTLTGNLNESYAEYLNPIQYGLFLKHYGMGGIAVS